jgi:4-amino-4-deoxy-L-arabinose transferase-like glycosyltransferase
MKTEQPPIEGPSVLDYIKSRLKFWSHEEKIAFPVDSAAAVEKTLSPAEETEVKPVLAPEAQVAVVELPKQKNLWPWRSLVALALALFAQRSWEPSPNRTATMGLVFYAASLAMLAWAYWSREWTPTPLPESGVEKDDLRIRLVPLIVGIPIALVAFLLLGRNSITPEGNLFTPLNVLCWAAALVCFVWAFWKPGEKSVNLWNSLKSFISRDSWQLKITRWTLLVLAIAAIIVFLRIYNLNGVPSEPFSDHAEKILDVYDVSQGETHIFFPRNTGREAIQMYLTLVVSWIFGTGLSFLSLKIGTVICGLVTLPYVYLLGKEFGGKRLGLLAAFFTGIAYWPNVISRIGLRFPLYPLFVAPTLYYLIRGLRRRNRNDFILSGIFLGFGLHGYSPFRIVPIVVVIAVGLYLLHSQSRGNRKQAIIWLGILTIVSIIVFLPLARYWVDNPEAFSFRALSRLEGTEVPLPGAAWKLLLSNLWNALKMFNWDDGQIWVHSVPYRPALDVVSGALFILGIFLLLIRYIRQRHWLDLFLLLAVPLLQLPSILSLAFPAENPALNRASGAVIPTFIIVAIALDGLLAGISSRMNRRPAVILNGVMVLFLAGTALFQNYDLVFRQFATQYDEGAWNTSEMGTVIKQFEETYGTTDSVWIVPYPYWVDTRLPGVWAGIPNRDFALWPEDFNTTLDVQGTKLIMLNVEDTEAADTLEQIYPQGVLSTFHSATNIPGKDFFIFFIPPEK